MPLTTRGLLALILASVAFSALAQLLLKSGMKGVPPAEGWVGTLSHALLSPMVLGGLVLYALGALVWLLVLARADLSFAYPFVGLGFVLTLALGKFVLAEDVSASRLAGTVLVIAGVVLIARGVPHTA
jgi:multidrug transporter EmrE-like cation transporter